MKVYYDTEFLEDGKTIDLISIGMVREDGQEYYAVNADMPWNRIQRHEWLSKNVVPHLPTKTYTVKPQRKDGSIIIQTLDQQHPDVKHPRIIRNEVEDFLADAARKSTLELWSWYSAYDHVALCQLWGPMVAKPFFIPHYSNDIQQEFQRFGNPQHNIVSGNHNALVDAHYHKALHEFIMQIEKDQFEDEVRWRARRQAD